MIGRSQCRGKERRSRREELNNRWEGEWEMDEESRGMAVYFKLREKTQILTLVTGRRRGRTECR